MSLSFLYNSNLRLQFKWNSDGIFKIKFLDYVWILNSEYLDNNP